MFAYHGTKSDRLDNIRVDGLVPRGVKPTQWTEMPSRPDLVYLTTYCHFFHGYEGHAISVVEIDMDLLDESLLLPDEDYLHQVHKIPLEEARKRLEEFHDEWEACLRQFGTCGYMGSILPTCITQTCRIDLSSMKFQQNWYWRSLGIMETGSSEFQTKGQIIRDSTEWVFGHRSDLPAEIQWNASDRSPITLTRVN